MTHEEYQDILREGYKMAVEDAAIWLEKELDELKTEYGKPIIFCNKKDFIEALKKAMSNE